MIVMSLAMGALVGAGVWCVVRAFAPQPLSLQRDLARLAQPAAPHDARSIADRLRQAAVRVGRLGSFDHRLRADLELLDRTEERFALERSITALVFAALPVLFAALVTPAAIEVGGGLVLVAAVGLGAVGFFVPVLTLRSEAERRRRSARLALGAYLDVVAIRLAGGAGPTSALADAAAAGQGWLFRRLDRAMRTSAAANTTPWDELAELAERLALSDLYEFASSMALAGTAGAAIRETLLAKADTLRTKALADAEADARHSSELLVLPAVAMLVAFMLLLGFPAAYRIMGF
jgi:tight adherence protein C